MRLFHSCCKISYKDTRMHVHTLTYSYIQLVLKGEKGVRLQAESTLAFQGSDQVDKEILPDSSDTHSPTEKQWFVGV